MLLVVLNTCYYGTVTSFYCYGIVQAGLQSRTVIFFVPTFPPLLFLNFFPRFAASLSSFLPVTSFNDSRSRGCWIINASNAPCASIKSHFSEHYVIPKELKSGKIRGNARGKSKINFVKADEFVRGTDLRGRYSTRV